MDDVEKKITAKQSYEALYSFLYEYWKMTNSDWAANFLSDLSTIDGIAMDRALQQDWFNAIEKALNGEVDTRLKLTKEK